MYKCCARCPWGGRLFKCKSYNKYVNTQRLCKFQKVWRSCFFYLSCIAKMTQAMQFGAVCMSLNQMFWGGRNVKQWSKMQRSNRKGGGKKNQNPLFIPPFQNNVCLLWCYCFVASCTCGWSWATDDFRSDLWWCSKRGPPLPRWRLVAAPEGWPSTRESWCTASGVWYRWCVSPDMIYEDVQRDGAPPYADNGWSSSEFESYDEQSDNETKPPTRSKVALACVRAHACVADVCIHPTWIIRSVYFKLHREWPDCFALFPKIKKKKKYSRRIFHHLLLKRTLY